MFEKKALGFDSKLCCIKTYSYSIFYQIKHTFMYRTFLICFISLCSFKKNKTLAHNTGSMFHIFKKYLYPLSK